MRKLQHARQPADGRMFCVWKKILWKPLPETGRDSLGYSVRRVDTHLPFVLCHGDGKGQKVLWSRQTITPGQTSSGPTNIALDSRCCFGGPIFYAIKMTCICFTHSSFLVPHLSYTLSCNVNTHFVNLVFTVSYIQQQHKPQWQYILLPDNNYARSPVHAFV